MSSSLFSAETGKGEPLVLLHGFCETHNIWRDFVHPLTEKFRVITLDLPGFGDSPLLPLPFTIDDIGDAVALWLEEKHLGGATVIGHSLGGYVALSLASNHHQLLEGMGLFHSTAYADTEEKKENRNRVIDFVRKNGVPPFLDTFVPGLFFDKKSPCIHEVMPIASKTNLITLISYSEAMRDRLDRTSVLKNSELPKLLIAGVGDTLISVDSAREMAKTAENLSYFELENVAHMGFFEAKEECQRIIVQFADGIGFNN
jgi:pimeloyl-ACP methyl ester carboxylesterase